MLTSSRKTKHMKRLILSVCMLLILAAFKAAEYNMITITGTVTDQSSGAPLPNAGIFVPVAPDKPLKNAGATGQNGKYEITVPSGTKELTFTATGYHTKKVKITGRVIDVTLTA